MSTAVRSRNALVNGFPISDDLGVGGGHVPAAVGAAAGLFGGRRRAYPAARWCCSLGVFCGCVRRAGKDEHGEIEEPRTGASTARVAAARSSWRLPPGLDSPSEPRRDQASDRASGVGGAFFMFMGQNHRYSERSHRKNPWEGVVGLDWRPPKPVVRQTELSRDNPDPEPARTERPKHPYNSPRPPSDVRAAHNPPRPARDFRAVAGRDFLDELDSDFDMDPQPYSGGVAGADPSLEMWLTGNLPGAPKPAKWTGARAAAASPRYAPPRYGVQQPPPRASAGVPDDRRRQGDLSLATKKKVEKAVQLIRSILTSWDSSLRKIFNTIDADRGGTIDLDEFSEFVRRVLHLQFDRETMVGIMAEFGGGHAEINYQRFCEVCSLVDFVPRSFVLARPLSCYVTLFATQLVMGQSRRDNSSLILGNDHTAGDKHSNSEVSASLLYTRRS